MFSYAYSFTTYSCVSWSYSHKNVLASSDYEGTVTLWDCITSTKIKTYQVRNIFFLLIACACVECFINSKISKIFMKYVVLYLMVI